MPTLPLRERATEHHPLFRLHPTQKALVPVEPLAPGENYRFHFDMTKCIGCHCCEVACTEQNALAPEQSWRRVGEIEGGDYPFTQRFHLSLGCNHCLEPACLIGCPVEAYTKDPLTGVVIHSADACIGCQYCTWNCQYGVPQFNPERGVVGKCDLCHNRLSQGRAPACVDACPEGAIQVEAVNVEAWRLEYAASSNAPGMPPAEQTISTTRVTLPANMNGEVRRADVHRVRLEHPHWPLVFMTVLMQLSIGAFVLFAALGIHESTARIPAILACHVALALSLLHLGRPAFAWRAIRMWRRSWLSREVLFFTLFAGAATAQMFIPSASLAAFTAVVGVAGAIASACIYRIPARPAWNMFHTQTDFLLTACILGPLTVAYFGHPTLLAVAGIAALAQFANRVLKLVRLRMSLQHEFSASAALLNGPLHRQTMLCAITSLLGTAMVFTGFPLAALAFFAIAELTARYLFFVSVVPQNIAAPFLGHMEVQHS